MDRALARNPEDRYATVTGFSEAVDDIVRGDAVATRPMGEAAPRDLVPLPPTRQSPARRQPAGIRFAIATGAALAIGAGAWAILDSGGSSPPAGSGTPSAPPPPAPPPTASKPDSGAALVERSGKSATPPPAPSPAPIRDTKPVGTQPAATIPAATDSIAADTAVPEPEEFDDPNRRQAMIRRAQRILNSPAQPAPRRAFAAASLAAVAIKFENDRAGALALYKRASALAPRNTRYAAMIRQLQDSVPE
jgi:hypothetical protein